MKIFILADEQQQNELKEINLLDKENVAITNDFPQTDEYKNYDAFLILYNFSEFINLNVFENKPVIINEVIAKTSLFLRLNF